MYPIKASGWDFYCFTHPAEPPSAPKLNVLFFMSVCFYDEKIETNVVIP